MFKNATIFRLLPAFNSSSLGQVENRQDQAFIPCGPTQERSSGWVAPREANGALVEWINGNLILKFQTETKSIPSSVIDTKFKAVAAAIEQNTGRKPGKKEGKEIREEIRLTLLPTAFPKITTALVWINLQDSLLVIGSTSSSQVDDILSRFADGVQGFSVNPLQTNISPVAAMSDWLLTQEPPAGFTVDRECELKSTDDSKAVVRYANHALDIEEVQQHIQHGKLPTRLALSWKDHASFVLTQTGQLKKIELLDHLLNDIQDEPAADRFDGDSVIFCGAMRELIAALVTELGGELVQEEVAV